MKYVVVLAFIGMLVVWPAYFIALSKFSKLVKVNHPQAWKGCQSRLPESELQTACRALVRSKDGTLEGEPLTDSELHARRHVSLLLYWGAALFSIALGFGLYLSVAAGKY